MELVTFRFCRQAWISTSFLRYTLIYQTPFLTSTLRCLINISKQYKPKRTTDFLNTPNPFFTQSSSSTSSSPHRHCSYPKSKSHLMFLLLSHSTLASSVGSCLIYPWSILLSLFLLLLYSKPPTFLNFTHCNSFITILHASTLATKISFPYSNLSELLKLKSCHYHA